MSEELIELYREKHGGDPAYGAGVHWHAEVRSFLVKAEVVTVLDYGCGKGGLMLGLADGWLWYGWDPAVRQYERWPIRKGRQADAVVCLDVLEHLPEEEVKPTLERIEMTAGKGVFLSVCMRPAFHKLSDGRNCHETVRSREWWEERILEVFPNWQVVYFVERNRNLLLGMVRDANDKDKQPR